MRKRSESDKETFGGFVRARREPGKNLVRVDGTDARNLSYPDSDAARARLEAPLDEVLEKPMEEKTSRHWPKKSLTKGNKNKLSIMALDQGILDKGDPRYAECLRLADNYRKHRARELVIAHGYVSSGVSSFLATAALSLAASRYLYEKSAETGDLSLLKDASKLGTDARQSELAAWELCAREAVARKKAADQNTGLPWLKAAEKPKRGRGRPRKDSYVVHDPLSEVQNAGTNRLHQTSSGQIVYTTEDSDSADGNSGPGEPSSGS